MPVKIFVGKSVLFFVFFNLMLLKIYIKLCHFVVHIAERLDFCFALTPRAKGIEEFQKYRFRKVLKHTLLVAQ